MRFIRKIQICKWNPIILCEFFCLIYCWKCFATFPRFYFLYRHIEMFGGIFNGDGCTLSLDSTTISGNTATDEGGGIFNKGPLTMTGGAIKDNTATNGNGGGVRMWSNTATFTDTEISGNNARIPPASSSLRPVANLAASAERQLAP